MSETKKPRLVLIESPLAANLQYTVEQHQDYAKACMRDSIWRGEAPYASHLLYAQPGILDDLIPAEREYGIEAGLAWGDKADLTAVYTDLGISGGMQRGIERAQKAGRLIEMRQVDPAHLRAHWKFHF
jgi:hypothetical protein